jgi:hypothetical protein
MGTRRESSRQWSDSSIYSRKHNLLTGLSARNARRLEKKKPLRCEEHRRGWNTHQRGGQSNGL